MTEEETRIISYCEQRWFLDGALPTPETLCETFHLTPKRLKEFFEREDVALSFSERGIPLIVGRQLLPEQVTAANTILNFADQRSQRKKLQDMGISPNKWAGWRKQPEFAAYLAERSHQLLNGSIPDAKQALAENVLRGDLGSIKFLFEITGEYTGREKQLDVRMILNKVLEIIQTHVKDPEALAEIARDFGLLIGLDESAKLPVVKGELL